jgi:hypothetical protein
MIKMLFQMNLRFQMLTLIHPYPIKSHHKERRHQSKEVTPDLMETVKMNLTRRKRKARKRRKREGKERRS